MSSSSTSRPAPSACSPHQARCLHIDSVDCAGSVDIVGDVVGPKGQSGVGEDSDMLPNTASAALSEQGDRGRGEGKRYQKDARIAKTAKHKGLQCATATSFKVHRELLLTAPL